MFIFLSFWENTNMDDDIKYFIHAFIRILATGIDLLLICCLFGLLMLINQHLHFYLSETQGWVLTGLLLGGWIWFEASNRRTLGKQAAGLILELPGKLPERMLRLLLRNLVKGSLIYGILWLGTLFRPLPRPYYHQVEPWEMFILPALICLALTLCLRMFGSNRQPQDWLSGSRVVSEPKPPTLWQQGFNFLGVGLTGGLILFLSLTPPASSRYGSREKLSSVKANMHTLQTIVETYAVDYGGVYPSNLSALRYEAKRPGREYWKEFTNPLTGKSGAHLSYDDLPALSKADKALAGQVIYAPVPSCGPITRYYIYGLDREGERIQDKGQALTLSNS